MSMEFLVATGVGMVTATGIYLMLRGRSFPVVLGLSLFGYAVNVFIFLMGRLWTNAAPILVGEGPVADPLPQALVLTAIVIGFALLCFALVLVMQLVRRVGTDDALALRWVEPEPTDPVKPPLADDVARERAADDAGSRRAPT